MDVGLYIDAHLGIGERARMVEEAGFSHLWVYDSPLVYADPYMAMGEAARATRSIAIGPGVTHPRARSSVATAQALGTLAVAAPGRVALGLGVGNSARLSLGMQPAGIAEMRDYALAVSALLRGEAIAYREGERTRPVRFIHPEGRWLDLSHPPEVWISAFGPRGQQLAGTYADAVMMRWEGPERLAQARERIDAGSREAGRRPGSVKIALLHIVYPVEHEDELEGKEAVAALGPLAVSRLRFLTAQHRDSSEVPEAFRPGFDEYLRYRDALDPEIRHLENYEGYLVHTPDHLRRFVSPESIRSVALVGDPDRVVAELRAMAAAGADHLSLQIVGPPERWCERMAASVLPALAAGQAGASR